MGCLKPYLFTHLFNDYDTPVTRYSVEIYEDGTQHGASELMSKKRSPAFKFDSPIMF